LANAASDVKVDGVRLCGHHSSKQNTQETGAIRQMLPMGMDNGLFVLDFAA
jgi:hypothetical protein